MWGIAIAKERPIRPWCRHWSGATRGEAAVMDRCWCMVTLEVP